MFSYGLFKGRKKSLNGNFKIKYFQDYFNFLHDYKIYKLGRYRHTRYEKITRKYEI